MKTLTNLKELESILKTEFSNKKLLHQAVVHRSYLNEITDKEDSNERLEFLGDAVLELLVSNYLYKKFPTYPEGKLTSLRSSIVNTKTLAKVAKNLKLGQFLLLSKGEEKGGGRDNESLLADSFEALLGAVYIDQKITAVKKILETFLYPQLENIINEGGYFDYKSILQEKSQEQYRITPIYRVTKEEGPDHAKKFFIAVIIQDKEFGSGTGKSKQEAEQAAAAKALEAWKTS
jgi:ribonuclease-3